MKSKSTLLQTLLFPFLFLLAGSALNTLQAQCNPTGNGSRFEFNLSPTGISHTPPMDYKYCNGDGGNCCGGSSTGCLDLVVNVTSGPSGSGPYTPGCSGMLSFMTAQGNFSAAYFTVATPNPAGGMVACGSPLSIGNNYEYRVMAVGTAGGNVDFTLEIYNSMGIKISSIMLTGTVGQAAILTICKPGNGCVEGNGYSFGCCAPIAKFNVTGGGGYCTGSPAPAVGLSGSEIGINYQLKRNGMAVGAPVPGTGGALNFGPQAIAGAYEVSGIHAVNGCMVMMTGSATVSTTDCSTQAPNYCACDGPDGRAPVTIKATAPPGQTWTVKNVIGLYSTSSPAAPAAPTPLAIGTPLVYMGSNMYAVDALRLTTKGFWVQVTNGTVDQDIQVGNPSW